MDLKRFLAWTHNVHESAHGSEFIYIGHDPAKVWSAFFKGNVQDLGFVDTLEEAKVAAHRLFDSENKCSSKLEWKLIPETEITDITK